MSTEIYVKMNQSLERLTERLRDESGQTAAEYVGIIVIVAAIIGAIAATGIGDTLANALSDAVDSITGG